MSKALDPGPVGERLRSLRQENGWTLAFVAEETGISKATLSKLENGKTNLSFTSVTKLAEGLQLPISALTTPGGQFSARRSLTRLGGGTVFEASDARYEILCSDLSDNHQAFMRVRVLSDSLEDQPQWRRHPGQEFLYVLSGSLFLHTEAYEPLELKSGDSIVFDSNMGHKYISAPGEKAELLITMQTHGYTDVEETLEELEAATTEGSKG